MSGLKVHYVSKFYLKNFGQPFCFYDKQTRKKGYGHAESKCWELNFYTEDDESTNRLETEMSQIEGRASMAMRKTIGTEDFSGLPDRSKMAIYEFVTFQFVRTLEYRMRHEGIRKGLFDALKQMGLPDLEAIPAESEKWFHLDAMRNYKSIIPWIMQKTPCLCKNETGTPLWTSDNPVVLHNDLLRGKMGFASPGVEIALPLTPKLLLYFYDRTAYEHPSQETYFARTRSNGPTPILRCGNLPEGKMSMEKGHVIFNNHLQTRYSTQYVFSNTQEFHMIEDLIKENFVNKYRYSFQT